jgi:hypothetical protein
MQITELIKRLTLQYPSLSENKNWGERGLFYNPEKQFPKGSYVLTFKEKDGKHDSSSQLNIEGKYRLNLKISKQTFMKLFEVIPKRPLAGEIIKGPYNFTELDKLMPHPVYGWMTWICIVNPTIKTIQSMEEKGLFEEAYQAAVVNINKKLQSRLPL